VLVPSKLLPARLTPPEAQIPSEGFWLVPNLRKPSRVNSLQRENACTVQALTSPPAHGTIVLEEGTYCDHVGPDNRR